MTPEQRAALDNVTRLARTASPEAGQRLHAVLAGVGRGEGFAQDSAGLAAGLLRLGRVALQFHPDRLVAGSLNVAGSLLERGCYVSQFVTRISAGGLTAYPGGDRDRWEQAMFGGAYQRPGVRPEDRPVYGALDLLHHADGPAPRFGSCFLLLRPEVLERTTLSVGDSFTLPADVGTAAELTPLLAGLLEELAAGRLRLGAPELDVAGLVRLLNVCAAPAVLTDRLGRAMDEYVEAQVHGPVRLAEDVQLLVVDPSFAGTPVETQLEALAMRYGFDLTWHPGFNLPVDEVPSEPRGPLMPVLAQRLRDRFGVEILDAAAIGAAARTVVLEPASWADWTPAADTLQQLKQLWHVLVLNGRPAAISA